MEVETFQIYEWRIENFSVWNSVVHGELIESPQFDRPEYIKKMELLPRGSAVNGLKIHYDIAKSVPSGGNLSLFGADGYLICTARMAFQEKKYNCYPGGVDFKEAAAKTKTQYEDRLTVRICFLSTEGHVDTVSTTLDVLQVSLNIDPKSFENIEIGNSKNLSLIHYNKKNYLDELLLKATRKDETIEFILHLLTKSGNGVSVESHWSLHKRDNSLVRNEEKDYLYSCCGSWAFSNSLKMSELVENGITIVLNLKIINGNLIYKNLKSSQDISAVPKKTIVFFDQKYSKNIDLVTEDTVTTLIKDFMCLYQAQKFSDLQLKCDNISFPVHRNILGARSPVFERLLSSDMKETASGTVDITDLDAPTLSHFLTFLYTGVVEDIQSDSAIKLYYAADKYQVSTLKKECSALLRSKVTLFNVCDILSLAYKHQDDELMSSVHGFILDNYSEVLGSENWRRFVKIEPLLAAETLTDFAAKSYVGKIRPQ